MAESRMELFIETLTGTAFELSCSPLETIVSIKAKIQYSEGIPVSQQHLIWKSQELNDDLCLQDYSINDGATLKLVLGMRGGPINTRQVSDTRKLKDLAEYVERSSETAGSGGRPFTVLVFHDGDKVHMYTLMERGECTVSPLSGSISETSSVASIKNVEDFDQDLAKENEVTRGKIAQLQEQLRALNINRPKKLPSTTVQQRHPSVQGTPSVSGHQNFYLPPLQRIDAIDSQPKQYSHKNAQAKVHKDLSTQSPPKVLPTSPVNRASAATALDCISSNISTFVLDSKEGQTSSNFLPYLSTAQGATGSVRQRPSHRQGSQMVAVNMGLDSIVKYDPSSMKRLPGTSSQALSTRRFIDLEDWLQTRPKTSPEKSTKSDKTKERGKRRIRHGAENLLSVGVLSEGRSSLMLRMFSEDKDASFDVSSSPISEDKKKESLKNAAGALVAGEIKTLKPFSLQDCDTSNVWNAKGLPKPNDDTLRPFSANKLPLIKTKKKSYKRCSLCSKKTGLATSYTCRCGKNFCASHRYAEVHHCSYDYKTEGRRLLQLNNPVVTASKLPKI